MRVVDSLGRPVRTVGQLGFEVRRLREAAGMTQAELAELAGVSRRWLVRLEGGHVGGELGNLMRVVRALGRQVRLESREAGS